jgi:hypothetical protein
LTESHKIPRNESFCFWLQIFLEASNADPRSIKDSVLQSKINWPKQQRFVLGDFMRFVQNYSKIHFRIERKWNFCTGVVDEIDHKIISGFNRPLTIDRNFP